MDEKITVELIKLIPSLIWVGVFVILALVFYRPVRYELIPRMTGLKALGVEATFVKKELDRAAEEVAVGSENNRDQVARRAEKIKGIIKGAHVLMVNDIPSQMRYVINILESLGMTVKVVTSTNEALSVMERTSFDLVISDMRRGDTPDEGQRFLLETLKRKIQRPTIFTVYQFEPERGVPPYAFGITNRVDEILNLTFDVLERIRG